MGDRRRRRRWRFGTAAFDEGRWTLTVDDVAVPIECKPLELLHELCLRAGEVVTKDELLESVWSGLNVVEASIPTAVAKLRRALGPRNQDAVVTVQRVGYRLAGEVVVESLPAQEAPRFAFAAGDPVPGRPQWRIVRRLGDSRLHDVWRARHEKTGETRVFKFADAPDRLRALKRETALSRFLLATLGPDGPFAAPLEWNLATAPFFLEMRDGGMSLPEWAANAGGLSAIPLDHRLEVARRSAQALAAVHAVGVLHRDVKPGNVLLETVGGDLRVRLVDFGSADLAANQPLTAYDITEPAAEVDLDGASATPFYRAPELALGAAATTRSDVYSLGLILYQLVVGDFGRVPAPGWEREVGDPLLRQDIADAAAGDPERRMASAAELADRLIRIGERRAEAVEEAVRAGRLADLAAADARRRARRPWVRAAAAAMVLGIVGVSAAAVVAIRQRDEARRQEAVARATYEFLADDLLARSNPYRTGVADETISAASRRASVEIEKRFGASPLIAARLHHSLARAFDQRTDVAAALAEYAKADEAFRRAGPSADRERKLSMIQWAQCEALSGDAARLPVARKLLAAARTNMAAQDAELAGWAAAAQGALDLAGEDVRAAQDQFRKAADIADAHPEAFDAHQRLNLRQRVAFTYVRLGDGAKAATLLTPLLASFDKLEGPNHPDTLNIRLNLVQALLMQKRFPEVIDQATALLPALETAFGPDHRRTLQLVATRQIALGSLGRYTEAAADGERVWRATAAHEGPAAFQAVAGRADLAETLCRAGQYAGGLQHARAALAVARAAPGPETALAMGIRAIVADCLIGSGHALEAGPLLAGINRKKVGELVGDPAWGAGVDLALAEVSLAGHDLDAARRHFTAADQAFGANADPFQQRQLERVGKAIAAAGRSAA